MLIARATLTLALLSSASCVMSPLNGDVVDSTQDAIELSGYTIEGEQSIRLFGSSSPSGPFTSWPGAHTLSSATGFFLDLSGGSALLYPWSMSYSIPPGSWGNESGPGNCSTPVIYLQVRTNEEDFAFYTFDQPGLFEPDPSTCITSRLAVGQPLHQAVPACASEDSPTIRIEAEPVCP